MELEAGLLVRAEHRGLKPPNLVVMHPNQAPLLLESCQLLFSLKFLCCIVRVCVHVCVWVTELEALFSVSELDAVCSVSELDAV